MQEALELPTAAVDERRPRLERSRSARTRRAQGRALNRRVEVEFWYDDPLQELPDEPQLCPVRRHRDRHARLRPAVGRIATARARARARRHPGGLHRARCAARCATSPTGPTRALRFVGYTTQRTLDRRTALVYGDDIGLSAARARRAMETIRQQMELRAKQAEYEGRGYVQSDDVVNAGFIQGETSHVVVQVVYDELAELDDYEGVDITRLTRELRPRTRSG